MFEPHPPGLAAMWEHWADEERDEVEREESEQRAAVEEFRDARTGGFGRKARMADRTELARLADAATPGPWRASRTDMDSYTRNPETGKTEHVAYLYRGEGEQEEQRAAFFGEHNREDLALIVALHRSLGSSPWVAVGERLPERGVSVIASERFYGTVGEAAYWNHRDGDGGSWEFAGERKDDCDVTHWMPMPEAPEP